MTTFFRVTLTLLLLAGSTRAQEPVGSVAALEGQAEVRRADATAWVPLAAGASVLVGDHIRTLAGSKVKVVLREDSVMALAPGSELVITEQLVAPAPVSRLQILFGTIKAIVTERYGEPQARFEVETPTAIAGVHGTAFLASYDPSADETLVIGLHDRTWVRSQGDAAEAHVIELGPGAKTTVGRGRFPSRPIPVPELELRRYNAATALRVAGTTPRREFGRAAAGINAKDAKRPVRTGQQAVSPQNQAVNQPILPAPGKGPKPPPPPPPVPGR